MSNLVKRHLPVVSYEHEWGPSGFDERLVFGQTIKTEEGIVLSQERVIQPNPVAGEKIDRLIIDYRHTGDVSNLRSIAILCAEANRPIPPGIAEHFIDLLVKENEAEDRARDRRSKGERLSRAGAWRRDQEVVHFVDQYCLEYNVKVEAAYEDAAIAFNIEPSQVRQICDIVNETGGPSLDGRYIRAKYEAYKGFAKTSNDLRPIELP